MPALRRTLKLCAALGVVCLLCACSAAQNVPPSPAVPASPSLPAPPSPTPTRTPLPTLPALAPSALGTPLPVLPQVISPSNADGLELLARWGRGIPYGLAFSPDGQWLALAASGGVFLRHGDDFLESLELHPAHNPLGMAFSPAGNLLALSGEEGSISLWRLPEGGLVAQYASEAGFIPRMAFSPDGKWLAAADWQGGVMLVQVSNGRVRRNLQKELPAAVEELAFSADGKFLYTFSPDEQARAWNLAGGGWREIYLGRSPRKAAFSPAGDLLAVWMNRRLHIFYTRSGNHMSLIQEEDTPPQDLAFDASGMRLAVLRAGKVTFWNLASSRREEAGVSLPGEAVQWMAFAPDGGRLAAAGAGLWLWQAQGGARALGGADLAAGYSIAARGRNASLDSGQLGGMWQSIRLPDLQAAESAVLAEGGLCSLASSADGRFVAAGTCGAEVALWDMQERRQLMQAGNLPAAALCMDVSADGRQAAAGLFDRSLHLWSADGSEILQRDLPAAAQEIQFSPDGEHLALRAGKRIMLLHLPGGKTSLNVEGYAFRMLPDGRLGVLTQDAAPGQQRRLEIWEAAGKRSASLEVQGGWEMAFSPDGSLLALGGEVLRVYDTSNGRLVGAVGGDWNGRVGFAMDGRLLFHAGRDGVVTLFGVR